MTENQQMVQYQGEEVPAVRVQVKSATEFFNEYQLDDESVLRLKTVLLECWRLEDRFADNGEPIYLTRSQNVLDLTAATNLKRPE